MGQGKGGSDPGLAGRWLGSPSWKRWSFVEGIYLIGYLCSSVVPLLIN